jgi:hypothetical protein
MMRRLVSHRRICAALLAAVVGSSLTISGVAAADPTSLSGSTSTYTGTGVAVVPGGSATDVATGIPTGYAELKASQFAAFVAGKTPAQAIVPPTKRGSGAIDFGAGTLVNPMATTCVGGYPCVVSITAYLPSKHEMRTYYCVVAFIQTVAVWDINTSYLTMGTGSELGGQDVLYGQMNGGSNGPGVWDPYALSWINSKFSSIGYGFYYLPVAPNSTYLLMNYIRFDLQHLVPDRETNYVRVYLSNGGYGGWQSGGFHATGSAGYNDTTGTVTSYDPWSYHLSGSSTCYSTYYSSSQPDGCFWTMPQANYFQAMDTSGNGTLPVWY